MPREYRRNSFFGFIVVFTVILILAVAFAVKAQSPENLFLPAVNYDSGGRLARSVAVADLNGDKNPDLVVANDVSGSVGVLLGNGDGTFQAVTTYLVVSTAVQSVWSVAVGDVNGDKKLDILVGILGGSGVGVLLGNGDGTFQAVARFDSGSEAGVLSIAVADLNGDGKSDLLTAGPCFSTTSDCRALGVLMGNGDGTFQAAVTYDTGGFDPWQVAVGDFNTDGKPDIAVANWRSSSETGSHGAVSVLVGNGDGTFRKATAYQTSGFATRSVAIADVNGDNQLDLLTADGVCTLNTSNTGCSSVLLGNGDATFRTATAYDTGTAIAIAVADVNGDAKPDALVTSAPSGVSVLLGYGDGSFQSAIPYSVKGGGEAHSIAVSDLNGDGRPDVVVATGFGSSEEGSVGVFLNNSHSPGSPTATTLSSLLNPSIFGQAVQFTAQVGSDSGTPTGTVKLIEGGTTLGSGLLVDGKASISVSSLLVGSNPITANYQASAGFAGSKSAPVNQVVHQAATVTGLNSSLNPMDTNSPVTFTADVTSQYRAIATGAVVFASGSQTLGTVPISGNRATLMTWLVEPGIYSVSARYTGDANNTGSTSVPLSEKVLSFTRTTLSSSLNPALPGQAIKFTSTVFSAKGFPPNGELVTFKNGSTVLGTAPLSAGWASLTIFSLPVGINTIAAIYGGDSNFSASVSPGLREVVKSTNKSMTSTVLGSNLNPSTYGQAVTLMAMATSSGQNKPTGNVVFRASQNGADFIIGRAPLDANGVASLTKSNLNGSYSYSITAVYSGDMFNLGSTSAVVTQVVKQARSAATITSSANPSSLGQAVTFTATITSPTVAPSGPVTFTSGNQILGTAQIVPWAHRATLTISALPVGSSRITVTYYGNSNIAKSSASLTQTVQ